MHAVMDNPSRFKTLVVTFAHILIVGELPRIEAAFSIPQPQEFVFPDPPAPETSQHQPPIRVLLSELRKKKAWAICAKYPNIRYHMHELNYLEVGDYVILPSTKRYKTCYYKVEARTGSRVDLIESDYIPRIS